VFVYSFVVGVNVGPAGFILALPIMLLVTFGMVSIGLILASFMESLESYGVIQTFVNLPLFFLSGALFPLSYFPDWLKWVSIVDPLTYGVDALRTIVLTSAWTPINPLFYNLLVLISFDLTIILLGSLVFARVR
jgi:ABC-2 type transport system permease protein